MGLRPEKAGRAPQGLYMIITSVDGRFASSVYLIIIIEVEARSVAGRPRTREWTGRSPSRTEYDVDVPYCVKEGLSIAGFLFMPAPNG